MADAPAAPKKRDSVQKRNRQNQKRHARNVAIKSSLKTINKKFLAVVTEKDPAAVEQALRATASAFDKAASKHVIHKNKASRKKARLARQAAAAAAVEAPKAA
ncbi:MAG: 30S ribosomal protein S20 [Candidatus Riflebacteria bacterium]|nr:30S ribosomal protein S20 [Candidatus Riflebacteria bacterium]